jgi:hypothetical protein
MSLVEPLENDLTEFVMSNDELEQLEDLLGKANFFEAVGAVRSELRHSDFLGYLLDPSQTHGLGDLFLKRFLQAATKSALDDVSQVTPIEIDVWDLGDSIVWREYENIDLLVMSRSAKFGVVIENKVDSSEHSNQLTRYREAIQRAHPGYRFLFLLLTIEGDEASDDQYLSISYRTIAEILQKLLDNRSGTLGSDVTMIIGHYLDLVRRHFMDDSELALLARKIYERHRRALDFIFEQRPDDQGERRRILEELIASVDTIEKDHCSKAAIRFGVPAWEPWNAISGSEGWTPDKRLLLFEFKNFPDRLALALIMGPGDAAVRESVYNLGSENYKLFSGRVTPMYPKFTQLWSVSFLSKAEMSSQPVEDLEKTITEKWQGFVNGDLPKLIEIIRDEFVV